MVHVIIMAGGKGTRMKSDIPKVLHPVRGVPIINRVLLSVEPLCARPTLVVGYKADDVIAATGGKDGKYSYARQKEPLGTGHAVMSAKDLLSPRSDIKTIIVLNGDHPLIRTETIRDLAALHARNKATITLGTFRVPDYDGIHSIFNGWGRIIRNPDGRVEKIVEFKDASEAERAIREVNLNYYCFNAAWLWQNIDALEKNNAAGEYYLTDMVKIAKDQGRPVSTFEVKEFTECLGINTIEQLRMVEEAIDMSTPVSDNMSDKISAQMPAQKVVVRGEPRPVTKS
jgi:UDP-N-acetylglucosamine diphosphorylase/glucosamine-1-phosphate N-acetyltransferase